MSSRDPFNTHALHRHRTSLPPRPRPRSTDRGISPGNALLVAIGLALVPLASHAFSGGVSTRVVFPLVGLPAVVVVLMLGLLRFRRSLRGPTLLDLLGAGVVPVAAALAVGVSIARSAGTHLPTFLIGSIALAVAVWAESTARDLIDARQRLQRLAYASQALVPLCLFVQLACGTWGLGTFEKVLACSLALLAVWDWLRVGRETAHGWISFQGTRDVLAPWCLGLVAVMAHPYTWQGPDRAFFVPAIVLAFRAAWAWGGPLLALFIVLLPMPTGPEPALAFVLPALLTLGLPRLIAQPIPWLWTCAGCGAGLLCLDGRVGLAFVVGTAPSWASELINAYRFERRPLVFALLQFTLIGLLIWLNHEWLDHILVKPGEKAPEARGLGLALGIASVAVLLGWGLRERGKSLVTAQLAFRGACVVLALFLITPSNAVGLIALGGLVPAVGVRLWSERPRWAVVVALGLACLCGLCAPGPSLDFAPRPAKAGSEAAP